MEGHPLKRAMLRGQNTNDDDFWEQVSGSSNQCSVKLVNKAKPAKTEEPVKVEEIVEPKVEEVQDMIRPIMEHVPDQGAGIVEAKQALP